MIAECTPATPSPTQTGKLFNEFTGALPPHITTKTAADTCVNQRYLP